MVDIISKRDGSRREDVPIKQFISQNSALITRLADQFSGGTYSASKKPKAAPQAEGLIIHVGSSPKTADDVRPTVRVSRNGRVIVVDSNSSRQLHHIGDLRRRDGVDVFVLATRENGFIAPVDPDIAEALSEIDGTRLDATLNEDLLAADIGTRLGITEP